jgi:hypothetical protein
MSVPAKLTLAQQELVHHNLVSVVKSQSIRPLEFAIHVSPMTSSVPNSR